MPLLTMVKTSMPRCILAGLLASGALCRAIFNSKHILNNAAGALVFFNSMTDLVETIHRSIPGSEWIMFENSSHMPHVEVTDLYVQVLDTFLMHVEGEIL
jgi:hypothetical protein